MSVILDFIFSKDLEVFFGFNIILHDDKITNKSTIGLSEL